MNKEKEFYSFKAFNGVQSFFIFEKDSKRILQRDEYFYLLDKGYKISDKYQNLKWKDINLGKENE